MRLRGVFLGWFLIMLFTASASAEAPSPFAPPAKSKPRVVRLLALPEYFDRASIDAFERESGIEVAYDVYESYPAIAERWRDGPYDLAVLPGPEVARLAASGGLQKLNRGKAPNAKYVMAAVEAKMGVYDPSSTYSVPIAWYPTGLVYGPEAAKKLGGVPTSWGALFTPEAAMKAATCGLAVPDAPDELFIAAWRTLGVDPAKAGAFDVHRAAPLVLAAVTAARIWGEADGIAALAKGEACLGLGTPLDARLASRRGPGSGGPNEVYFVQPREGGPMAIDAFVVPRDAAHADEAYLLMNSLLKPETASRNAATIGLTSAEQPGQEQALKQHWPVGAFNPAVGALVEQEWRMIRQTRVAPLPPPSFNRKKPKAK